MSRKRHKLHRLDALALLVALAISGGLVFGQMAKPHDEPTSAAPNVVYPEAVDTIRFPHGRHAELPCARCHAQASTSRSARDDLRPPMQACAECHVETEPRLQTCGGCHVGHPVETKTAVTEAEHWRAVRPAPMKVPAAAPRIRFDHARHVARLVEAEVGLAGTCRGCHAPGADQEPSLPTMQSCGRCHDGTSAPDRCATCHLTDVSTGRVRTRFEGGGKTHLLQPDNHDVDWIRRHGAVARARAQECASCHLEQDCATCHVEQIALPFAVHPPNFVTVHAIDARANMGECTDCHTVQTFCTSCHVQAGVVTERENAPPPRRQFHPPGWLDASMPNNHGVMARRNITECASCHTESDCVSCHAGVNPHPPEFRLECGRWLDANPRPCARCHTNVEQLRGLCR